MLDDVKNAITHFAAGAFGVAGPQLSPSWSGADPTFDSTKLTLTFGADWKAPIAGIVTYRGDSAVHTDPRAPQDPPLPPLVRGIPEVSDLDGTSPAGACALVEIHPQAYLRLEQLYVKRFGDATTFGDDSTTKHSLRPVPRSIAIRLSGGFPDPYPGVKEVRPGDTLPPGEVSFHDARGLPIDPLAVACAFADLIAAYSALLPSNLASGDVNAAGGVKHIGGLGTAGTFVHVVTPHGGPWHDPGSGHGLHMTGGSGARIDGNGPFALASGAHVAIESTDTGQPLRIGLATYGTLGTSAVSIPALPSGSPTPALARDFVRLCAVDLRWHILGNRSASAVDGVPAADDYSANEEAPKVRDGSTLTYLTDGVGVLGSVRQVLGGITEGYLVAPVIGDPLALPPAPDTSGRWPAFPAPAGTAGGWDPATVTRIRTDGITAVWSNAAPGSKDVVVTIAAGIVPAQAHVRVFPRVFKPGTLYDGLIRNPTLYRGNGTSVVAPGGAPTVLVLTDPLSIGSASRPAGTRPFHFDMLIVPRPASGQPRARLFGGLTVGVSSEGAAPAIVADANDASAIPADHRAVSAAPLLGLPPSRALSLDPSGWGSLDLNGAIQLVREFLNEAPPREGPRYPTMARYDSYAAMRTGASPNQSWKAVVTGGFLARESRTAAYRQGNPGNAAGAEIHAPGVKIEGPLAYDLGRAAVRRTTDLVQRLVALDSNDWNEPAAPASPGTTAGAVLQTVAPVVETPELTVYHSGDTAAQLAALPATWSALVSNLTSVLGTLGSSISSHIPSPTNGDRLAAELKREVFVSHKGRRDAQWAIRRAVREARELIYVEAPSFAATAYGDTPPAEACDIIKELADRLDAQKNLKVIVAISKEIAYGAQYGAFAKQQYVARAAAITALRTKGEGRVLVFHPMGFPGRPLNVRTTSIVVDDVWCYVGTSVPRRRGFTFDGSIGVATFDRKLAGGYSASIRDYRRKLMALHLGAQAPAPGETPAAAWIRLAQPAAAFAAAAELLAQDGRALIEPLWQGTPEPPDGPIATSETIADPDGRDVSALLAMLVAGLADLETRPS